MAGTMTWAARNSYPTPLSCGQCGQKQPLWLKHLKCVSLDAGGGPHSATTASWRLMVGMEYFAMIFAAWLLRLITQPSLDAEHM